MLNRDPATLLFPSCDHQNHAVLACPRLGYQRATGDVFGTFANPLKVGWKTILMRDAYEALYCSLATCFFHCPCPGDGVAMIIIAILYLVATYAAAHNMTQDVYTGIYI